MRQLATKYGTTAAGDHSAKDVVLAMAAALREHAELDAQDRCELDDAMQAYSSTWQQAKSACETGESEQECVKGEDEHGEGVSSDTPAEELQDECEKGKAWEFHAGQLTYNHKQGEWASQDRAVLQCLFDRFVVWLRALMAALGAKGVSATMEVSTRASEYHVHMHAYFHLQAAFKRRGRNALDAFIFEAIRPHLETNTAKGKSYMGAIRFGHFYRGAMKV